MLMGFGSGKSVDEEQEVNLKSAMNGTHIALKYMCLENNGTILNFCGGGAGKPHVFAAA